MRIVTILLAASVSAILVACGGGGDGGSGGTPGNPQPQNRPPVFSSAAAATFPENTNGIAYTAAATDADGNPLTFSISGGADAALFQISSAGALTFRTLPDFEAPADSDRNNIYLAQITVSDGTATATLDLQLTVTNLAGEGFRVRRVATGFNQPLAVTGVPGSANRMFVVEKGGRVRNLDAITGAITATPFLDISSDIATDSERGLLGFAPAPDFATSGMVYVYATNPAGDNEIRSYRTSAGSPDVASISTKDVLLRIPHPGFSNHNGGWIGFGPSDGLLYVGSGDGGGGGDPGNNAQNPNSLLGKLLRIDVRSDAYPADPLRDYAIPAGNAFPANTGAPEVFALGLRNPFRAGFDTANGGLYIGDVGQDAVEEIDLIPSGVGGLNFGWRLREGTQPYAGGANSASFTAPVAEYGHGSGATQGNSVTGGTVYRGPVVALQGQYIFADFVTPNIWSIPVASIAAGQTVPSSAFVRRNTDFAPDAGAFTSIASFGTDQAGSLYIVDFDGEIFVIEATA